LFIVIPEHIMLENNPEIAVAPQDELYYDIMDLDPSVESMDWGKIPFFFNLKTTY